ncbi:hypothetical protein D779_1206 [Imhoffiella purpurea]|uniref:Uncharacterized protein n=1 Tax=Imhoffiella purpurea TaxID=1249627 RepID=W9V7R4_9GAMM|nr:hypothetical protein D779_1206 [Imhoffiella purpurea]
MSRPPPNGPPIPLGPRGQDRCNPTGEPPPSAMNRARPDEISPT